MIFVQDYDEALKNLGNEFFISSLQYVPALPAWAKQNRVELSEPLQPMKLITQDGNRLVMVVQSEIREELLDNMLNGLGVRWSLMDNIADVPSRLNSTKKRLAYCLLKEYARTGKGISEDDLQGDEWAISEMEKLGFFNE